MTAAKQQSREIDGNGRTVRQLLTARKYTIDYYQREYKWTEDNVKTLLNDIEVRFLQHDRRKVSVESIPALIWISASSTMAPQLVESSSKVSSLGPSPELGLNR